MRITRRRPGVPRSGVEWVVGIVAALVAAAALYLASSGAEPQPDEPSASSTAGGRVSPGDVVWTGDYAARDVPSIWAAEETTAPERIEIMDDPQEGRVLRYEVRDGETADITENERVETRDPRLAGETLWRGREGEEWWFGWRFKLSPDFETQTNFNFLTQWKGDNPDTGSPAFALAAGETLRLKAGTQADQVLVWKGPPTDSIKGQWQDIVVRMKVTSASNGFIEMWLGPPGNPVRQTNLLDGGSRWTGQTLHGGFPDQYHVFKQGIYRDANAFAGTSEHFIKAPRIGRSFSAVAPR